MTKVTEQLKDEDSDLTNTEKSCRKSSIKRYQLSNFIWQNWQQLAGKQKHNV